MREALDEPIPGGAKYAYVFGSALLFVFLSQVITGVFLAMYYVPSADHAHTPVAFITKVVTGGSFIRSLHVYGASALMILLVLHMSQVFFYGAYKRRRELLWMSGGVLFLLMLSMAFTGYLLPWDQRAYFATTVGTNLISLVPWIGPQLKEALLGGSSMGTLTLSRDGDKVTGKWSGDLGDGVPVSGTWRDGYLEISFPAEWKFPDAQGHAPATLAGWIDGDSAGGRMKVETLTDGKWTATRKP